MAGLIKAVSGTRDLLPPDTETWNFVEATVRDLFRLYNFHEIRTPVIEDLQLFRRSVGEETDIVSKEMFAWEDRARAASEKAQWLALGLKIRQVWYELTSSTISMSAQDYKGSTTLARNFAVSGSKKGATGSFTRSAQR